MKAVNLALSLSMALMLPGVALAEKGDKGPSDRAHERASENASFKREDGKSGKGEKDNQKGHRHDGEYHEHDDQDGDGEGRKYRRTEQEQQQEQEQVRDRDREQERIPEKVQTEQRQTSSERVESAGTGAETAGQEKPRTGYWQRFFEQRREKKAAGGN